MKTKPAPSKLRALRAPAALLRATFIAFAIATGGWLSPSARAIDT